MDLQLFSRLLLWSLFTTKRRFTIFTSIVPHKTTLLHPLEQPSNKICVHYSSYTLMAKEYLALLLMDPANACKLTVTLRKHGEEVPFSEDRTDQLERLTEEATTMSRARGVNGYAAIRREFDKKDMHNECTMINMVQKMYVNSHYPPAGWNKWTMRELSVCQRMGEIMEL